MKILLADDAEVVRLMIGRFLSSLGHTLLVACDGLEAVDVALREQPDLILMDMLMPGLDGSEAAKRIRGGMGSRWVSIVLITAVEEVGKLADAMEIGVDDYLLKPVNYRILEAKIKAVERTVDLNRKVHDQAIHLSRYFEQSEEEKRVARHLMEQLINRERLSDSQLHYWVSPAESLSGDLIAAARTPADTLYVLLADGIGHGLTAALNVLPLSQPFYAMTARGFAMTDILLEMHKKVREVLPLGRFIALAFVSIDFVGRTIEVWNGGLPALRLYDVTGNVLRVWPSRNLPLGILPVEEFALDTEQAVFDQRAKLVMYSDGLVEARNPAGEQYGVARLDAACTTVLPECTITQIVASFVDFQAGAKSRDDVSVAVVDLDTDVRPPAKEAAIHGNNLLIPDDAPKWRYGLELGAEELRSLRTVPLIMSFISQIKPLASAHADVFLILTELFINALDHGLLNLSSDIKSEPDGMERYLAMRAKRLAELREGSIQIELAGYGVGDGMMLYLRVADTGPGFDWTALDVPDLTRPSGRGIALVRSLAASLRYGGCGNTVEACYLPRTAHD